MTALHATLAPSAAHRWMRCPGSVRLSAGITEVPSAFAAEGTAAHRLAEVCLRGGFDAGRFEGHVVDTADKTSAAIRRGYKGNGHTVFPITGEMIEAVQLYLDVAREYMAEADEFEIEHRLNLSGFVEDVFGTGDVTAYIAKKRRIIIIDLKYGKGVAVEVVENEQEMTYGLGVAERHHNRGVDDIELVIVQPRAPHRDGPVRRWIAPVDKLYEHAMAMQQAALAVADPKAPLIPGSWCQFCKAAAICPAIINYSTPSAKPAK